MVTTSETAEYRIAEAAARAWARQGGPPLALLVTRIDLIASQPDAVLGPIWRSPYQHASHARLPAIGARPGTGRV